MTNKVQRARRKRDSWRFWWLVRWRSIRLRRLQWKVEKVLGGAATHFALAASYFTDVRVIGVVGKDFTAEHEAVFERRGIDTDGIERADGLSFHWTGERTPGA